MTNITQAQQAINILTRTGEFAMLPFAMAAMQPDDEDKNWLEFGICKFDDGSFMNHSNGSYKFSWSNPETGTLINITHTSAMPARGRPQPFSTRKQLIAEPTREDVWSRVIHIVEQRAGLDLDDPVITRPKSYSVAPDLYRLINESSHEFEPSQYIEKYHDNILDDVASTVLKLLPDTQRQSLTDTMQQAVPVAAE